MKNCELCSGGVARMHCESDQANLCWDCDLKVHAANFLVAKHTRTLLCHVCQNPTPWLASGHHITPAVSVCRSCTTTTNSTGILPEAEESSEEEYEDEEDDYYNDDDDDEQEEEEAENQVVPWSGDSSSFSISKPVPLSSPDCMSSDGDGDGDGGDGCGFRLKRTSESLGFCSDDEIGCSSSHGESSSSTNSSRLLKQPRLADEVNNLDRNREHGETESRSTAIISSLKRLQKNIIINDDASATIIRICRLSRDQSR